MLFVPFFKQFHPNLVIQKLVAHPQFWPLAFLPFVVFVVIVIVGSSNAVNLTDGLDGLAISFTVIAAERSPRSPTSPATACRRPISFALPAGRRADRLLRRAGRGGLGFLWCNAHPADVFMGDVGSLALGGAIGTVAVMIKQELLLPFVGGIFVIEALSVILQVGSFKLRGNASSRWRRSTTISSSSAGGSRRSSRAS